MVELVGLKGNWSLSCSLVLTAFSSTRFIVLVIATYQSAIAMSLNEGKEISTFGTLYIYC